MKEYDLRKVKNATHQDKPTKTKGPIVEELEEINQLKKASRGYGRENRIEKVGSRGRVVMKKYRTFCLKYESNDSDLRYKDINPNTGKEKYLKLQAQVAIYQQQPKLKNEGSCQQQSKVTVSDLLQIFDSNDSNDNIDYYQENYMNEDNETFESPRKSDKLRSSNYMNEYDETAESPRRRSDKLRLSNYVNKDDEAVESPRKRIPDALSDMTNVLEVCQWLVLQRPDPEISNNIGDDKELAQLWHEEIKCLFLRCRNPPAEAIENFITKIFNYELYSNEAVEIICYSKRVLTDFRSKFNQRIVALVIEFKNKHSREEQSEQISAPSRNDINEFITQEVTVKALKRYLSGANIEKLKKCGTMNQLVKLTKKVFKICFNAYDTKAIKNLDYLTINCKIPSRS
ncbi:15489_t:CDS:10, partial [Dentiscutata erythropus]